MPGLAKTIYGVRKGDIEFIKTQKNWVNLEDYVTTELSKPISNKLIMSLVLQAIDNYTNVAYNSGTVNKIKNADSPYALFVKKLEGFEKIRYSESSLKRLSERYAKNVNYNPELHVQKFVKECQDVYNRYPLLAFLRSVPNSELAQYINLIDTQEGI